MSKVFKMFKMGRTNEFRSKVESCKELEVKQGHKPGNNRSSRRSANIQKMKYQRCNNFQLFAKCEHPENEVPKMQHFPALCQVRSLFDWIHPGTAQEPQFCSIRSLSESSKRCASRRRAELLEEQLGSGRGAMRGAQGERRTFLERNQLQHRDQAEQGGQVWRHRC